MLDPEIAAQLRGRGWDAQAIQGDLTEMLGLPDADVLAQAGRMGRTLVTDNVRHFLPLHLRFLDEERPHAGLLLADSKSYPRSKRTIGIWVRGLEAVLQRHELGFPNGCEWLP